MYRKAEYPSHDFTQDEMDLVLDFSCIILKNAGLGAWGGIRDTGKFAWEAVTDPAIVFSPIIDTVYDATLIATAHINDEFDILGHSDVSSLNEESEGYAKLRLLKYVKANQQEYDSAVLRMKSRVDMMVDGVDDLKQRFMAADTKGRTEQLSYGSAYVMTSFLVPSWFVRGISSFGKMANNLQTFGTVRSPRLFHNSKWDDIKSPLPKITTLSLDDVRGLSGDHLLQYVVLKDKSVILAPLSQTHPYLKGVNNKPFVTHIIHPEISRLQPVISAGTASVAKGKIGFLDNLSGHYLPDGRGLKSLVEHSFFDAGFQEAIGKFKLYNIKVKNPKRSPIITQESIWGDFSKNDILYGGTIFSADRLSRSVQEKLKNATPESILDDFDDKMCAWILENGTEADKALLQDMDLIKHYEHQKETQSKDGLSQTELSQARLEKIKTLMSVSGAFSSAASLAAALGNDKLAVFLGAGSGIASIGAGIMTGLSFTGAGLVLSGAAMLVSVLSKRRKGDGGLGKALQAMFDKLNKLERDIFELRQLMVNMNHAMYQDLIAHFTYVHQSLNFIIQQIHHQQHDINMIRQAVDLVLDNQYQAILIGAENYGEGRRTDFDQLTQTQHDEVIRKHIPGLKQIIQVAFKSYHNGVALYEEEHAGFKDEIVKEMAQLYHKGQSLGYFARSYRDHDAPLSKDCDRLPNFILWKEAATHLLRFNEFYSSDDMKGDDLAELIKQGDALLACIQSMQTHKQYLFNQYFKELTQVISEMKAPYTNNSADVVELIERRHWHMKMPKNLTIVGGSVETRRIAELKSTGNMECRQRHSCKNTYNDRIETKQITLSHDLREAIGHGEFSMLSALGLGAFHVRLINKVHFWDVFVGRVSSTKETCGIQPYPVISFKYNSGKQIAFHKLRDAPKPRNRMFPPTEERWECYTDRINTSETVLEAIRELKQYRNQAIQAQKVVLEKNAQRWNQTIIRQTLKIRLLCWTLGVNLTTCKDIPGLVVNQTELSESLEENIQLGQKNYSTPLPMIPKKLLDYELALNASRQAIEQATTFMNPYYVFIASLLHDMKDLLLHWHERPHVQGVSEQGEIIQILLDMKKQLADIQQDNQKLRATLKKNNIFVDAMKIYTPSWPCTMMDDNAYCDSPEIYGLQRDMKRWVNKSWDEIDPTVHCEAPHGAVRQCHGSEISYVEYMAPSLLTSALNGAVFAIVPEALGDFFWITGFASRRTAEQIKSFFNFAMLLFMANCFDGYMQRFVQGYIIGVAISCTATTLLKRAGCSESHARIAGNAAGFFVNRQLDAKHSSDMAVSTAYYIGSNIGLWAEKKWVERAQRATVVNSDKQTALNT